MADPFTWMALGTAATVASGAIGVVGALQQGRAAEAAGNYNAAVNERNAGVTLEQGRADLALKRRENLRRSAETRAAFGASGLAFDGSALDYFQDQAEDMALDESLGVYQSKLKAQGYRDQAKLDRAGAKGARTASYLAAVGEVAQTGASLAQMRLKRV
jgi:hypothetical protein